MTTRTCAGCRRELPQGELVRLAVVDRVPYLVPDAQRRLGGRGVWVMPQRRCLEQAARKGGFARALRRKVAVDPTVLAELLVGQLERRLEGLAQGARRARRIAIGADASKTSLREGRGRALWLADDAARREGWEREAERASIPCFGGIDRARLGAVLGREAVAVAAIEDEGLAGAIRQVCDHLVGLRDASGRSNEEPRQPMGQRIEGEE